MSNLPNEDELKFPDTDYELMQKIDDILYGEHPSPYSRGDALLLLIRGRELKLLESRKAYGDTRELEGRIDELSKIPIRDEENEWDAVDIVDEVQQHIFTRLEALKDKTHE